MKSTARPFLIHCEDGRHRGVKGDSRCPRGIIYYLGGTASLNEQSQKRTAPQDEQGNEIVESFRESDILCVNLDLTKGSGTLDMTLSPLHVSGF
jgi:hypothetical protein